MYAADQVRLVEPKAAALAGISMYQLMERAGQAVVDKMQQLFPKTEKLLVIAGHGNNGGDAYVVARLAKNLGISTTLCEFGKREKLSEDAANARKKWLATGATPALFNEQVLSDFDLCVDGLLGTGIRGEVRTPLASVIGRINASDIDVLAIDVASGLNADTGAISGIAIEAAATVTFIGIKSGLVTSTGKQHTGHLFFDDLGVGDEFNRLAVPVAKLISFEQLNPLPPRPIAAHKGSFGKLLCIGGNAGYAGAIRIAGEAALRCGAGLVKVYCHEQSQQSISIGRPELMTESREEQYLEALKWATAIVIGPGLGKDNWAYRALKFALDHCLQFHKPLVLDADALNLIAQHKRLVVPKNLAILTPHPAEAARLIGGTVARVESDRYQVARDLSMHYDAVTLLKGAGTLVTSQNNIWVCTDGNPGMASPGMGDLLSGVLGSLLVQGMSNRLSAIFGVCLHSAAADMASKREGERGLMASDLLPDLRKLVNKEQRVLCS